MGMGRQGLYSQMYDGYGRMHDWGWFGGHGFMGLGFIFWLAIFGFLIWAVVYFVRAAGGDPGGRTPNKSALEILEDRYARGEIDTQEYEDRRKHLSD